MLMERIKSSNSVQPFPNGNNWLELRNGSLLWTGHAFKSVTVSTAYYCKGYKSIDITFWLTYFVWLV